LLFARRCLLRSRRRANPCVCTSRLALAVPRFAFKAGMQSVGRTIVWRPLPIEAFCVHLRMSALPLAVRVCSGFEQVLVPMCKHLLGNLWRRSARSQKNAELHGIGASPNLRFRCGGDVSLDRPCADECPEGRDYAEPCPRGLGTGRGAWCQPHALCIQVGASWAVAFVRPLWVPKLTAQDLTILARRGIGRNGSCKATHACMAKLGAPRWTSESKKNLA